MINSKFAALFVCMVLSTQACQCPCTSEEEPMMVLPDAKLEAVAVGTIRNVHEIGSVLTAGQPTVADFELLKERGVRTVIPLRTDPEVTAFDESEVVEGLGMTFKSIPFRAPDTLTDEVFDNVRESLNSSEGPVILHCGSANRVGGVWIAWRVLDGGVSIDQAVAEATEIGLRTPGYKDRAIDYISRNQ